jgi:hypothetical protein
VEEIESFENRGDFLAIYARAGDAADQRLNNIYRQNFQSLLNFQEFSKFRIQSVQVDGLESKFPDIEVLVNSSDFWMSDHSRYSKQFVEKVL